MKITFTLNGQTTVIETSGDRRVLDLLREDLHLSGTKEGCGEGECGACTILLNDKPVNACLLLACQLEGTTVATVEGLNDPLNDQLDPIQQAFLAAGAVQCGFCTPGMVMSAKGLLHENPTPNREEIRTALAGNLCRCTGYSKIIDAVELAAQQTDGSGND